MPDPARRRLLVAQYGDYRQALLDRETITGDDLELLMDNKELPPLDTNGKPAPTTAKAKPAKPAAEFVIEPDNNAQAEESKPEGTTGAPEAKTDTSRNNSNENDR